MTTIATDGKSMAGDGMATMAGTIVTRCCKKIHHLKNGSLAGGAGDWGEIQSMISWLEDGADRDKFPRHIKESALLVLRPDGRAFVYDGQSHGFADEMELPVSIGSGEQYAMGAMDAGATPRQAVRIAAKRSPNTGGKITEKFIKEKK